MSAEAGVSMSSISPRLRVLYLIVAAIGLVLATSPAVVAAVALVQVALWFWVGFSAAQLGRQVIRLWVLALFVVVSYALTSLDPAVDRWTAIPLGFATLSLNLAGALAGLLMVLRIVLIIMASQIARAGDPRAIAAGLSSLRVPQTFALSIDAVLTLLGEQGGGRGRGGGGGGGRGRGGGMRNGERPLSASSAEGFWSTIRRVGSGDVGPLLGRLENQLISAERHVREQGTAGSRAGDIAAVSGVALTMLSIKMVKILPSLPFAPGHKMVVLLPLYVVAARLTRTRFGATYTGLTMGTVAFLMGDGRYGIFEILKHVTPGLLCDALLPLMMAGGRMPGRLAWSLFGSVIGVGRFATVFAIILVAQPPAVAYALLLPGLATDIVFGFLSGYVTFHVVGALERVRGEVETHKKETAWASS